MLVQHYCFNCQNALFLTVYVPTLIRGHYWSVWLEYSVISQRLCKKKKWNHAPSKGLMWKSRFYILLLPFLLNIVLLFILIYFFARISLNKYVYFMLQSAIFFMEILCIQYCSCWELKLLIKIIPSSEMSISQMCCYISVTFIYKLSVHNLFFIYSFIV